ncbi:MAG: cell envelope integrity protein CreD [Betaproteobacteria bacterium]
MKSLLATKVFALGLVMLVLMAALSMIGGLASERLRYRAQAADSIRSSLAGPQTLAGAVMTRRCTKTIETIVVREKQRTAERSEEQVLLSALPQTLHWSATSQIEPRYRGLYKVNSFNLEAVGDFTWDSLAALAAPSVKDTVVGVRCDAPSVEFAIADVRGVRSIKVATPRGAAQVAASASSTWLKSGFKAALHVDEAALAGPSKVQLSIGLVGLESLGFVPLANQNSVTLKSDWAHPSFQGAFLPQDRKVDSGGFEATWNVSSLASSARSQLVGKTNLCDVREVAANESCLQSFGVDFIDPINPASLSDRAIKYGVMFIVLTFAGLVVLEVLKRVPVHPVQYLLIGAALASFFLLLLSLSEHIPFLQAYIVAALACIALLTAYAQAVLGGWARALPLTGGLAALYGVLYLVLQSEQHALLAGSMLLFVVLAGVMLLTRDVKWGRLNEAM